MKKSILKEIEQKRVELNEIADKNGMSSSITIRYSQELDKMLYEYQQFQSSNNGQRISL
ncbi:aspartyl-phosphate phosphatase Spo0E family protein [Metabacillus sp. 84]|uniref:aspartyl-phosphate phosphatase Spo0E family protein n=1 Tax=unclassified Metabacillus TaxID=2675274 RepID=UPI003CEC9CAF